MPQDTHTASDISQQSNAIDKSGYNMRNTVLDLLLMVWVVIGYLSFISFVTGGIISDLTYWGRVFFVLGGALGFHISIRVVIEDSLIWPISHAISFVNTALAGIACMFAFFLVPVLIVGLGSDEYRSFAIPALLFIFLVITPVLDSATDVVKKVKRKE